MVPTKGLTCGEVSPSLRELWLKHAKRWELESILDGLGHSSVLIQNMAEKNMHQFNLYKGKLCPDLEMVRGLMLSNSHQISEQARKDILEMLDKILLGLEGVAKSLEKFLVLANSASDTSVRQLANDGIEEAKGITYSDICDWFGQEQKSSLLP